MDSSVVNLPTRIFQELQKSKLRSEGCESTAHLLVKKNIFTGNWREDEFFNFFNSKNEEESHLDELFAFLYDEMKKAFFPDKGQLFLVLLCYDTKKKNLALKTVLSEECMTQNAKGSSESKEFSAVLFHKDLARILWRYPELGCEAIQLFQTDLTAPQKYWLEQLYPSQVWQNSEFCVKAATTVQFHDFFGVPYYITKNIQRGVVKFYYSLLEPSANYNRFVFISFVRKEYYNSMKSTSQWNLKKLYQDLDNSLWMFENGLLHLAEIKELFCNRYSSGKHRKTFFKHAVEISSHPFLSKISDTSLRNFFPSTAVGSTATFFLKELGLCTHFRSASEPDILLCYAKILADLVDENDPPLSLEEYNASNERQSLFMISFLGFSCRKLNVRSWFDGTDSLIELLQSSYLGGSNLFCQCLRGVLNGEFNIIYPQLVKSFSLQEFTLRQMQYLTHYDKKVQVLADYGLSLPSTEECKKCMLALEPFDRLIYLRQLCSPKYSSSLLSNVATFFEIEKEWMSGVLEQQWKDKTIEKLIKSSLKLSRFFDQILPEVKLLLTTAAQSHSSRLFDTFMYDFYAYQNTHLSTDAVDQIMLNAIKYTMDRIHNVFSGLQNKSLSVFSLQFFLKILEEGERSCISEEFKLLRSCGITREFYLDNNEENMVNRVIMAKESIDLLNQAKILFLRDTPQSIFFYSRFESLLSTDKSLPNISLLINEVANEKNMTIDDLYMYTSKLFKTIVNTDQDYSNIRSVTRILYMLSNLTDVEKIWFFFASNSDFIGEDGDCTLIFLEAFNRYVDRETGEKCEMLDAFKAVSNFITSLMRTTKERSVCDAIRFLLRVPQYTMLEHDEWIFFQRTLKLVNSRMATIEDVFAERGELFDTVASQYKGALKGYCFYFNLESHEVSLSFTKSDVAEFFNHTSVLEFIQLLRFEKNYRSSMREETSTTMYDDLLLELEFLLRALDDLKDMYNASHYMICSPLLVTLRGNNPPFDSAYSIFSWEALIELNRRQGEWDDLVSKSVAEQPCLALLSPTSGRTLSLALQRKEWKNAAFSIASLFGSSLTTCKIESLIKDACEKGESTSYNYNWLHYLSYILSKLQENFKEQLFQKNLNVQYKANCRRYSCTTEKEIWVALAKIYQQRHPLPCEILWCDALISSSSVDNMLYRVKYFPDLLFTFVRCDLLPYQMQEKINKFLFLKGGKNSNVCFIDYRESAIRLGIQTMGPDDQYSQNSISQMISNHSFPVCCFCGPSGSGKTFHINKAAQEATTKGRAHICHVVITESFVIKEAMEKIRSVLLLCDPFCILIFVVRFSVGCYCFEEHGKWAEIFRQVNIVLYCLVLMRCVVDPLTGNLLSIPSQISGKLLIELPPDDFFIDESSTCQQKIISYFPILDCQEIEKIHCQDIEFELDDGAKDVAKYLKAFDNGRIDTKCDTGCGGDFFFLLDTSGSMITDGNRLGVCKKGILNVIDLLHEDDRAALATFDTKVTDIWPLNYCTAKNMEILKMRLKQLKDVDEGTCLYSGVLHAAEMLLASPVMGLEINNNRMKHIVILTDGSSDFCHYYECQAYLEKHREEIQFFLFAINVRDTPLKMIKKTLHISDEFVFKTSAEIDEIQIRLLDFACKMSVREKIEKDAESITDEEIKTLIAKYMVPKDVSVKWSPTQKSLWMRYMRRRCSILDSSRRFDQNTNAAPYGSTTLKLMLLEADHAVGKNHCPWVDRCHEHLVYREEKIVDEFGNLGVDYKWSVIASGQKKGEGWEERASLLESLEMCVPDEEDLENPLVLESYLAYSVGAALDSPKKVYSHNGRIFDFPLGSLSLIREEKFVLTEDYLMKMLLINERIKCRVPCIIKGETGVSKTRVVEMLFQLKNQESLSAEVLSPLTYILNNDSTEPTQPLLKLERLCNWLGIPWTSGPINEIITIICNSDAARQKALGLELLKVIQEDPSLDPLKELSSCNLRNLPHESESQAKVVEWFLSQRKVDRKNWSFVPVCVHASMTEKEIKEIVDTCAKRAQRILQLIDLFPTFHLHQKSELCIFFDEFNTSSCMGVIKEIIIDRTLGGEFLPTNLVPIGACNPYREEKKQSNGQRLREQGTEWVSGHYNVRPLPRSIDELTWDYGSLQPSLEEEFVRRKISFDRIGDTKDQTEYIVKCVTTAHRFTRLLAKEHVKLQLLNAKPEEVEGRGNSTVSLRDFQRFFRLFYYFRKGCSDFLQRFLFQETNEGLKHINGALHLSIALVYYFRLSAKTNGHQCYRKRFASYMKEKCGLEIQEKLSSWISEVAKWTEFGAGIVQTESLQENIFVVLFCLVSKTPVLIKGPPGTSKTLAVQIIRRNANGEYSLNDFYRALPALSAIHYQCSRQSSSNEIIAVFERAIKRQAISTQHGDERIIHFVFMDEAGLPERERESLKVLHYFLESREKKSDVGFVAITNELLDAAKTNRCNSVSRVQYGEEELQLLVEGCVSCSHTTSAVCTNISTSSPVGADETKKGFLYLNEVIRLLCLRFEKLRDLSESTSPLPKTNQILIECAQFFGLRDFMHWFKLVGRILQSLELQSKLLSLSHLIEAFERNFNGVESWKVYKLLSFFLSDFWIPKETVNRAANPVKLLELALTESACNTEAPVSRYILITETTNSDGILHELRELLGIEFIRVSPFQQSVSQEQLNSLVKVRYCAAKGWKVGLVNVQSTYEGLYDLLNQHFSVTRLMEKTILTTNIAMGSQSVNCDVLPSFFCIIVMNEAEIRASPLPFLSRLEKYRMTMKDILYYEMSVSCSVNCWDPVRAIIHPLYEFTHELLEYLEEKSFYGVKKEEAVVSSILALRRRWSSIADAASDILEYWNETVLGIWYDSSSVRTCPTPTRRTAEDVMSWLHKNNSEVTSILLFRTAQLVTMSYFFSIAIPERLLSRLPVYYRSLYLTEEYFDLPWPSSLCSNKKGMHRSKQKRELIFTRCISSSFDLKNLKEAVELLSIRFVEDYKCAVDKLWNGDTDIIVHLDSKRSDFSLINYCRDHIDSLYKSDENRCKTTRILVEVSYADSFNYHMYDTVFCSGWTIRFLDSIGFENPLPWLHIAFPVEPFTNSSATVITEEKMDALKKLIDTHIILLADQLKCIQHQRKHEKFSDKVVSLETIQSVLTYRILRWSSSSQEMVTSSFYDHILSVLCRVSNHENGSGDIQTFVQNLVLSQAQSPLKKCLSLTLESEVGDFLLGYISSVLTAAIPAFAVFPSQLSCGLSQDQGAAAALCIMESFSRNVLLETKYSSLSACIPMPFLSGFPFYSVIFITMSTLFSLVFDNINDEVAEDDFEKENWDFVVEAAKEALDGVIDPIARAATSWAFTLERDSPLCEIYLLNFVVDTIPECSEDVREAAADWFRFRLPANDTIFLLHALGGRKKSQKSLHSFLHEIEVSKGTPLAEFCRVSLSEEKALSSSFQKFLTYVRRSDPESLLSLFSTLSRLTLGRTYFQSRSKPLWTKLKLWCEMICISGALRPSLISHPSSPVGCFGEFVVEILHQLSPSSKESIFAATGSNLLRPFDLINSAHFLARAIERSPRKVKYASKVWSSSDTGRLVNANIKEFLGSQSLSCFDCSSIFDYVFSGLQCAVEDSLLDHMGVYIPRWLVGAKEEESQNDAVNRAVFLALWKWFSFVYSEGVLRTDREYNLPWLKKIWMTVLSTFSRRKDLSGISSAVLKKLCVEVLVILWVRFLKFFEDEILQDASEVINLLGLGREKPEEYEMWVEFIRVQLGLHGVNVHSIREYQHLLFRNKFFLELINEWEKKEESAAPICATISGNLIRCFPSSIQISLMLFDREMRAVEIMRNMWLLSFLFDMNEWVWSHREKRSVNLLDIADTNRRTQWNIIKVGLEEIQRSDSVLSNISLLPETARPVELLSEENDKGERKEGLFEQIMNQFLEAYNDHVLKYEELRDVMSTNFQMPCVPVLPPAIHALSDVENILGGNTKFLHSISGSPSNLISVEKARETLRQQRCFFYTCTPVAEIIEDLCVPFQEASHETYFQETLGMLRWYILQHSVVIQDKTLQLKSCHSVTRSFNDSPITLNKTNDAKLSFLRSFQHYSLRKLERVLSQLLSELPNPYKKMEDLLKPWVLQGGTSALTVSNWLGSYIDVSDAEVCSSIISMTLGDMEKLRDAVVNHLTNKSYIFAEKPPEMKEIWPAWVDERVNDALRTHGSVKELKELLRFLSENEFHVRDNLKDIEKDHHLFLLISNFFSPPQMLYKVFPILEHLADISEEEGMPRSPEKQYFFFSSSHFFTLQQTILNELDRLEAEVDQGKGNSHFFNATVARIEKKLGMANSEGTTSLDFLLPMSTNDDVEVHKCGIKYDNLVDELREKVNNFDSGDENAAAIICKKLHQLLRDQDLSRIKNCESLKPGIRMTLNKAAKGMSFSSKGKVNTEFLHNIVALFDFAQKKSVPLDTSLLNLSEAARDLHRTLLANLTPLVPISPFTPENLSFPQLSRDFCAGGDYY